MRHGRTTRNPNMGKCLDYLSSLSVVIFDDRSYVYYVQPKLFTTTLSNRVLVRFKNTRTFDTSVGHDDAASFSHERCKILIRPNTNGRRGADPDEWDMHCEIKIIVTRPKELGRRKVEDQKSSTSVFSHTLEFFFNSHLSRCTEDSRYAILFRIQHANCTMNTAANPLRIY